MANILVADDNPDQVSLMCELLTIDGHRVEKAFDGTEAIMKIRELVRNNVVIDLVITDMDMPGANGLEVAKEAKKARVKRIIISSANHSAIPPQKGVTIRDKMHLFRDEEEYLEKLAAAAKR